MSSDKGFSLLELLCVLGILSIFFHFTSRFNLFHKKMVNSTTSSLLVLIKHARHKAIIQHEYVVMCGSIDMQHCDGHWGRGILVLTHRHICHRFKIPEHIKLTWRGCEVTPRQIKFDWFGFAKGYQGTFRICNVNRRVCRMLVLSPSGIVREK